MDATDANEAVLAVIEARMDEQGLNASTLALAAGATYRRIHAVLRRERTLTSETLALIAKGLGCAVASLRLEAGTLSPAERDRLDLRAMMVEDLLATDPLLSPDGRETLMRLYR
ncbi:MAG: hypothetical protein ACRD0K_12605 [Egibacteraceae bacterium]